MKKMNNSFLFPYDSIPGVLIYDEKDLELERFISYFVSSSKSKKDIIKILEVFETNQDNILLRQELFCELTTRSSIFHKLCESLSNIQKLQSEYYEKKIIFLKYKTDLTYSQEFFGSLFKDLCLLVSLLIDEYCNMYHFLQRTNSKVLQNLFNQIKSKVENPAFIELRKFCVELSYEKFTSFIIKLNDQFRIISVEALLTEKSNSYSLPKNDDLYWKLAIYSKITLTQYLTNILDQLLIFDHYIKEMDFIKFVYQYYQILSQNNLLFCYPSISKEIYYYQVMLYDNLQLFTENKMKYNKINLKENTYGLICFDNTNSYRRQLLRTLAINQILAQSGMPLLANKANMNVKSCLIIQLSSSEHHKQIGGRFEYDCYKIANYLKEIRLNTLLILNEVFESTDEINATKALITILDYLTYKDVKWIIGTRLGLLVDQININTKGYCNIEFINGIGE